MLDKLARSPSIRSLDLLRSEMLWSHTWSDYDSICSQEGGGVKGERRGRRKKMREKKKKKNFEGLERNRTAIARIRTESASHYTTKPLFSNLLRN